MVHISEKPINVTLIPLNSSNSIPSTAISQMQDVYTKAGVTLNIKTASVLTYDGGGDNKITTSESGVFDYYTDEEKSINAKIKALPDYDPKTYYLIYSNLPSDKGIDGFMELGGQFGYIFTPPSGVGGLKTASHELAHGVFALQHPFANAADKGKTPFLMDYGSGTELGHLDWAQINNPALKYYGFQGDSQGEFSGYHLTPDWKPFSFSGSSTYVTNGIQQPNGAVYGVKYNTKTYNAIIENGRYTYKNGNEVLPGFNLVDNLKDDSIITLFWNRGVCGNHEEYTAKWSYLKDKKGFNVDEVTETGKINFIGRVKCESDSNNLSTVLDEESCKNIDIAQLNDKKKEIISLYNNNDLIQLVTKINESNLCVIKKLSFDQIKNIIEKIVSQNINEIREIAVLKLIRGVELNSYPQFTNLLLENNEYLLRKLIDEMHNHSVYFWDGNNLTAFNDLINSIVLNSNASSQKLYLQSLKKNNYNLLKYIWSEIDIESKANFVSAISLLFNKSGEVPDINYAKTEFDNFLNVSIVKPEVFQGTEPVRDNVFWLFKDRYFTSLKTNFDVSSSSSNFKIELELSELLNYEPTKYEFTCEPFDWIVFRAQEDIPAFGLKQNDLITVPAIFAELFQEVGDVTARKKLLANVLSVFAIGRAPSIIGTSAFAITVNTTFHAVNIGMNVFEDTVIENFGQEYSETWKSIYGLYNLLYLYDAYRGFRNVFDFTVTKVNNVVKIKNLKLVLDNAHIKFRELSTVDQVKFIDKFDDFLINFKKCTTAPEYKKTLQLLLEFRINCAASIKPTESTLTLTLNETLGVVVKNGSNVSNIGSFTVVNGVLALNGNVKWLPSTAQAVEVAKINGIAHIENNLAKLDDLVLVKNNLGEYFLKILNSNLTNTFIAKITPYSKVLSKYNAFNLTTKTKFESDFGNAPATTLEKLNANNGELVDVWNSVKYRLESRKDIKFLESLIPSRYVTMKHVPGELSIENKTYGYKILVKGYHKEIDEVILNPPLYGNAGLPNPSNSNSPIIVSIGTATNPATKGKYRISDIRDYSNDNMPYTAKIEVEIPENSGNFFPKSGVDGKNIDNTGKLIGGRSSMFPRIWDLDRIAEETAYVRSKIDSTTNINSDNTYSRLNFENTFEIKMYLNGDLNDYKIRINSSFPKIN
ncbi:hypothetical protein [Flavobacterium davisii]|uniref:Uncharacterized protein n=1 Tax=Flavobacterium columnare TaxID=996 RepID=A0A8G0P558_9FLAO|nr:hypothetical protein [Flavobacterium davisii]QYS89610.1 hypothetical protein JJC05_04925 [Flavobacterium davisii]